MGVRLPALRHKCGDLKHVMLLGWRDGQSKNLLLTWQLCHRGCTKGRATWKTEPCARSGVENGHLGMHGQPDMQRESRLDAGKLSSWQQALSALALAVHPLPLLAPTHAQKTLRSTAPAQGREGGIVWSMQHRQGGKPASGSLKDSPMSSGQAHAGLCGKLVAAPEYNSAEIAGIDIKAPIKKKPSAVSPHCCEALLQVATVSAAASRLQQAQSLRSWSRRPPGAACRRDMQPDRRKTAFPGVQAPLPPFRSTGPARDTREGWRYSSSAHWQQLGQPAARTLSSLWGSASCTAGSQGRAQGRFHFGRGQPGLPKLCWLSIRATGPDLRCCKAGSAAADR